MRSIWVRVIRVGTRELVTVRYSESRTGGAGKRFLRLRVTLVD
jgi:hypothetical protein